MIPPPCAFQKASCFSKKQSLEFPFSWSGPLWERSMSGLKMTKACMWSLAKYSLLGAAAYSLLYRISSSCLCFLEAAEDPLHADRVSKFRMICELQENLGVNFVGALRIPDTGDEDYQDVDLVILIKRKLYLVEVKNWSDKVKLEDNGCWCQKYEDGSFVRHGNVVEEVKKRVALLESYLLRRGLELSPNFIQLIIVLANPDCRVDESVLHLPGVYTFEQWNAFLTRKARKNSLRWMMPSKRQLMKSSLHQQLVCVLNTAPTWDRLTFEKGDIILGNFLHFDGFSDDLEVLKAIKRSRVDVLSINSKHEYLNILGLQMTTAVSAEVSCSLRNYHDIVSKRENKDNVKEPNWIADVRGDTQVVFRVLGSMNPQMFRLSSLVSIHLSA